MKELFDAVLWDRDGGAIEKESFRRIDAEADPAVRGDASLYFRIMACAMPFTLGSNMFSAIIRCAGDTRTARNAASRQSMASFGMNIKLYRTRFSQRPAL